MTLPAPDSALVEKLVMANRILMPRVSWTASAM